MGPLPPIKNLIAFEAAARNLSFTKTADELHLTQGAISKQIINLEEYLRVQLFNRQNNQLSLTAVGQVYYDAIRKSLVEISDVTGQILSNPNQVKIRLVTTSAFASCWILPLVSDYRKYKPDISIQIIIDDSFMLKKKFDYDIAIGYSSKKLSVNKKEIFLFSERVFPVCSPNYIETQLNGDSSPQKLFARLLHLEAEPVGWIEWKEWFTRMRIKPPFEDNSVSMNDYNLLLQAAMSGEGVALGWNHLVDKYLESDMLVTPTSYALDTQGGFYMHKSETYCSEEQQEETQKLCDYILEYNTKKPQKLP